MRSAKDILEGAKPIIDRMSDGLKVVGSGNAAGLVGMIAALNTVQPSHVHTVELLKPAAIIFALGVFAFAVSYLLLMYAYVYLEKYVAQIHPNVDPLPDEQVRIAASKPNEAASVFYMRWSIILGMASTHIFFLGFIIAFVGLVRY